MLGVPRSKSAFQNLVWRVTSRRFAGNREGFDRRSQSTRPFTGAVTPDRKGASMALYIITYTVRISNCEEYSLLYDQLGEWRATHLQNSEWLASLDSTAVAICETL